MTTSMSYCYFRNLLPTVTARDHNAVVTSHLLKLRNCGVGQDLRAPLDTVPAAGGGMTPSEIRDLIDSGALFVINHSGGKDSQLMHIELAKLVPKQQLLVVHADLGHIEWPGAKELAAAHAAIDDIDFIVARASNKTFLEMVKNRHATRPEVPSWPSSSTRQCTSDLKRGPIQREVRRYAKAHGFGTVVNCLGLRAEESPGRAKRDELTWVKTASCKGRVWYEWLPIHGVPTKDVIPRIRAAGHQEHFAYGLGNERLSCVFCIMGSKNDIQNGAKHRPELLAEYAALEAQTGYTMHMSRIPLVEIAGVA